MNWPSNPIRNLYPRKASFLIAALAVILSCCLLAKTQTATSHQTAKSAQPDTNSNLNDRIQAAIAAQASGDPAQVAKANKRLLAVALYTMGRLRISEGAYSQAVELYRASADFESLPDIHAALAVAEQLAGNQDEAIRQATTAIASESQDPRLYITLARAYIAKKRYADADRALTEALRQHPNIDTLYMIATTWLSAGQPDSAKNANLVFDRIKQIAGDSGSLHVLMGRAYRDAGMMPEAVKEFERAIQLDTTTPHAHYFLGLAHMAMNEWQPTPEAQAEMEKELQYHPHDFIANYMLGYIASTQHRYPAADQYLNAALAVNPNLPEPYLYLGLDAFAQQNDKVAEAMLRKAVELTGTDESRSNYQIRRAYVDLSRILSREGRQQEADTFSAKARDLENKVMQQTQRNASAMLVAEGGKNGAMPGVVPLETQHVQDPSLPTTGVDPASPVTAAAMSNSSLTPEQRAEAQQEEKTLRPILGQSYSDLATAEALQRDYAAALTHYEAAEQWDPDISGLEKNLGQAAFKAENYSEAVHGLSAAVKQNPDALALRAMLGMAYFQMQRYGDAATAFYPLGEPGMRDSTVGYAWAASLTKDGDLKHATEVLETYQGGTQSNDALFLVGQLWTEIGDYDRAVSTLRQVLASDPSYPKIHYNIAMADIQARNWTDARSELNAQLAATPADADSMYDLGFVDMQESKNDDAMKLFEQVIGKHPDYADAQYQIGKILLDRGQAQGAVSHLEAAARFSPDKGYMHYQLQKAYRGVGRTADADREAAIYQQIENKSRAQARDAINQTLQQKQ